MCATRRVCAPGMPRGCWLLGESMHAVDCCSCPVVALLLVNDCPPALTALPVRLCSILNDQAAQLSNELEASQDTIRVS